MKDSRIKDPQLDAYEQEIEESLDDLLTKRGKKALTAKQRELWERMARDALKKDERINIRITKVDLDGIKRRAAQEGMPYQTLVASLIHKYVTGQLVDGSDDPGS